MPTDAPAARNRPVTLVVFDLGGVLVRIAGSWERARELAGFIPDRGPRDAAIAEAAAEFGALYESGKMTTAEFDERVSAASGGFYSPAQVRRIADAYSMDHYEGVDSVFDVLETAGVPAGILSNTNEAHWERLAGLMPGEPEYPAILRATHLHASHLLGVRKPEPEIYHLFSAHTGHDAAGILFFDDREDNVLAARGVGWRAEVVDPTRDTAGQIIDALRAHGVIPDEVGL